MCWLEGREMRNGKEWIIESWTFNAPTAKDANIEMKCSMCGGRDPDGEDLWAIPTPQWIRKYGYKKRT